MKKCHIKGIQKRAAHTSNLSMRYLRGQFTRRLMSKGGDWPWPPRSPDLAICDFFLWGYLKQKIWNVPADQYEIFKIAFKENAITLTEELFKGHLMVCYLVQENVEL